MSKNKAENIHKPVLRAETLELLKPQADEVFVDATLGLGGHTEAILSSSAKTKVIGIDQDTQAIDFAQDRLEKFGDRIEIFHSNFSDIKQVLAEAKIEKVDGILADLGVSSLQFDSETRGFSFRFNSPLDMRMDTDSDADLDADLDADSDTVLGLSTVSDGADGGGVGRAAETCGNSSVAF